MEYEQDIVSLLDRDAFKDFTIFHMHRWREGISFLIEEHRMKESANIWAKCLYVPKKYLNMGITPHQFFNTLIKMNNEKINSINSSNNCNSY